MKYLYNVTEHPDEWWRSWFYEQRIAIGDGGAETEWQRQYQDAAGRVIATEDAAGAWTHSRYRDFRPTVVTRQQDADGVITLFTYDSQNRLHTTALDLNRNSVINTTDPLSYIEHSILTAHGELVHRTETYVRDDANNAILASRQDISLDGRRSWSEHWGQLTTRDLTLNGSGQKTETITRPDGVIETRVFDHDRLVSSTITGPGGSPVLSSQTHAYDPHGRLITTTDARAGTTTYTYDALDRVLTHTTPPPASGQPAQTTARQYDALGRVLKIIHPDSSETAHAYNHRGQLTAQSGALTHTLAYSYDAQGRVKTLTTTGQAGPAITTWNYHPQTGLLTAKTDATSQAVSYTHTPAGRLLTRAWARGITTTYAYDDIGRPTGITYSDATPAVVLAYNRLGQTTSITDAGGQRVQTHAPDGRLLTVQHPSGILEDVSLTHSHDALLRRAALEVNGPGAIPLHQSAYGYDSAGRLQTVSSGPDAAAYDYLPNSSLIGSLTRQRAGGPAIAAAHVLDALGGLQEISTSVGAAPPVSSRVYTHNARNQRAAAQTEDGGQWLFDYDDAGQVISGQREWSGSVPAAGYQFGYGYDGIGNRTETEVNGRQAAYAANALNQYTQRDVPGALDVRGSSAATATVRVNGQTAQRQGEHFYKAVPADNSTAAQYPSIQVQALQAGAGPGGEDLVSESGGRAFLPQTPESFQHDADGNLISDGRWTYTWDGENRLIAMESHAPAPAESKRRLEFVYDSQGRRLRKRVSAWNGTAYVLQSERRFVYDNWNLVAELDAADAVLGEYVWGLDVTGTLTGAGGVGGLLLLRQNGDTHYPCYDGNGNITALIHASDGSVTARYDYGPFGEPLTVWQTSAVDNPIRFSSKYTDSETGLVYYGFRYYSPELGRWPNRDPIEERGGINLYGMVGNDAVNNTDELGLKITKYSVGAALITTAHIEGYSAFTQGNWTRDLEITEPQIAGDKWEVKISGSLQLEISASSYDYDEQGRSSIEHERIHERIWADNWNTMADNINPVEGKYCTEKCADIASRAATAIANMYYHSNRGENTAFDIRAYPRRLTELGRMNEYIQKLQTEAAMWRVYDEMLDKLEAEWRKTNAKKKTNSIISVFCVHYTTILQQ